MLVKRWTSVSTHSWFSIGLMVIPLMTCEPAIAATTTTQQTIQQQSKTESATNPSADSTSTLTQDAANSIKKNYTLAYRLDMESIDDVNDINTQKTEFYLGIKFIYDVKVNEWMSINITPKVIAQNGYVQSPDNVNSQSSRIDIKNASIDLKPLSFIKISVGTLSEVSMHSRIFLDEYGFPAARLSLFNTEDALHHWRFTAYGEAAIPNSTSLSNNSNDPTATPSLTTAGLVLRKGDERSAFEFVGGLSAYQFQNLPMTTMTTSAQLGNSATNTSGGNYELRYQFQGVEGGARIRGYIAPRWLSEVGAQGVMNSQAPSDRNTGWEAMGGIGYTFSRNFTMMPYYEYFNIDSDATVAAYNLPEFGTNRAGYMAGAKMWINKEFKIRLAYGQSVPLMLGNGAAQYSEMTYLLRLETTNVSF